MKDYYQAMGLNSDASFADIRKSWRELARKYHPDRNPDDPLAEEHFKEVQEAYRILSDAFLRKRYDMGAFHSLSKLRTETTSFQHYFKVKTAINSVKQCEEFAISFTYTGRGRIFKKPSFENFFITGSPYVSNRIINHDGFAIKETTFTYILCAIKTGSLEIGPASIRLEEKLFASESIKIDVTSNKCHFTKNNLSDGKPHKLIIHYSFSKEEGVKIISEQKKNHAILIPRSKIAYVFHNIGFTMKIVFMIWGTVMFPFYFDIPVLLGLLAGNLLGGINCIIMYRIAGVKSKYFYARQYPVVANYITKGYRLGESPGMPLIRGDYVYNLNKLIL